MPITKLRVARGLKANLPTPPNGFEPGRPYFATDTRELFIGVGLNSPMVLVAGSSSGSGGTPAFELNGIIIDASTGSGLTIADSLPADPVEGQQVWVVDGSTTIGGLYIRHNGSWNAVSGIHQNFTGVATTLTIKGPTVPGAGGFLYVNENPNLMALSFPDLASIGATAHFGVSSNPTVTSIDLSSLTNIEDGTWFFVGGNASLTNVDLSALTRVGNGVIFQIGGGWPAWAGNPSLTSLSFPTLTTMGESSQYNTLNFDLSHNPALASVSFPTLTSCGRAIGIFLGGCALTEDSVNFLLIQLATNLTDNNPPGQESLLDLSGGTNAAPSGDGATAADTLRAKGWGVNTN